MPRLAGFNALESYGPVHRWGDWTHADVVSTRERCWRRRSCKRLDLLDAAWRWRLWAIAGRLSRT